MTRRDRQLLELSWRDVSVPLLFMLSLSFTGLHFLPALLVTVLLLINRLIKNRYDLTVMIAVLATSSPWLPEEVIPVRIADLLLVVSLVGILFYRKNRMVKQVSALTAVYCIYLFLMAMMSEESMAIQVLTIRQYMYVLFFIVPLWVFSNREFEVRKFFRSVLVFTLIIATFYAIDAFILGGFVLVPADAGAYRESLLWYPAWQPLSGYFPRKYPAGFFIVIVAAYPLARYYRMKWWMWLLLVLGFLSTRTMTFIVGFFITYIVFQGAFKRFMKYVAIGTMAIVGLYFIDTSTGGYMRVSVVADQFFKLATAQDDQDIAEFGSTRMAQILPKLDALVSNGKLMTGFGFLHPTKSDNPKYEFFNEYYTDWEHNFDSIANYVEVTQFNTLMHLGVLGLLVQCGYFLWIFLILKRRGEGSAFYMSTLLAASVMGVGGFAGLNSADGLAWVSLSLGVALLVTRRRDEAREREHLLDLRARYTN